jgi:hypothetical protein
MNSAITQFVNGSLIFAIFLMTAYVIAKSNVRTARLFGWFAIIMSVTLIMVEGYGWYRRGDWQIKSAFDLWNEMQRGSLIWMDNHLPSFIWKPLDYILHFPAWLVFVVSGILLLLIDHFNLQRKRVGAKPAPLWKRLRDWIFKPEQEEEADKA